MKNKKILIIIGVIVIILLSILYLLFLNKESDAIKFKKEYESLNNTTRDSDGAKYNNISIDKSNPIKYVDTKGTLDVLESDKAILYIGANWCPWCRSAVPVLFEVAKKYNIKTIYYLNLDDEKSSFEIKDGKLIKTVNGTDGYYKLLDKLDDLLRDYKLTDENNIEYDTKEKRIYMPYVLGIKKGRVVSSHVGTITLNENQTKYSELTTTQHDELFDIYSELFDIVYGNKTGTCNTLEECN